MKDRLFADLERRGFLIRCCETAGAMLLPWTRFQKLRAEPPAFHFEPHYRQKAPVDDAVRQIRGGADAFLSEKAYEPLAEILQAWSGALLNNPPNYGTIHQHLTDDFSGSSWKPINSTRLRPVRGGLEMRRVAYRVNPSLPRDAFLAELQSSLADFSNLMTADLQVFRIQLTGTAVVTGIRYELVGSGRDFFRETRTGTWTLEWTGTRVARWQIHDETRTRARERLFVEITRDAFQSCPSYEAQLSHGADYWRSTIDGACGIDIYGHNGVSVGDIDGSSRDSIYVCQPAGLPNRLYRNRGDGTFEDITEGSGVGLLDNTACALFADFTNSGRQDLLVVRADGPLLFVNGGAGKFRLRENAFRFATEPQGTFTGAAAADYDRDGHLDVYFCLYSFYQGTGQYRSPTPYFAAENGPPNFLMRNSGNGTFVDVTAQSGMNRNNTRYSFCCAWGDINGNGWPDLYVVNDFGRKNLYRNNGDGTFTDIAPDAGVEDVGAGMSVCWFDCDNDGLQDLYVANMWTAAGERITHEQQFQHDSPEPTLALYRKHAMGNSLFRNSPSGKFVDNTPESQTGMGRWSWSSDAWDFDHDGHQDLYVTNGMISGPIRVDLNSFFWRQVVGKSPNVARSAPDYEQGWSTINELIRSGYSWSGYERNVLYANAGGTFYDVSGALGLDFREDSRSFVLSDLDGDGRQEMLLKNRNAPQIRLMRNTIPDLPPAISFRLHGTKSNRDAIGAKVTVKTNAGAQTRYLQAGSGFLCQHSKDLFFGLGPASGSISATITWPSGHVQEVADLPPQCRIIVMEGVAEHHAEPFRAPTHHDESPGVEAFEIAPERTATWLLAPVAAPDYGRTVRGQPILLCFSSQEIPAPRSVQSVRIDPMNKGTEDICSTYNLLFRYVFDSHRDLPLPAAFLIDSNGQIVRIYTGNVEAARIDQDCSRLPRNSSERLARALPFSGIQTTYQFDRNYLSLGSVFFQRGYFEASAVFFASALKQNPASAEAYYGLGSAYLNQNKSDSARECFEKAAQLKPSYPETGPNAWNNLGLLAARAGDTEKAIDYFNRALQLNPDYLITLENLGSAYRRQKRWDQARATLEHALSVKPDAPEANYGLGMIYAQLDDTNRAYDYLQKALEAKPDYPEALNNLAILYLRTRRPQEAVTTFERCIRVAPDFDQAYLNLARVYAIQGSTDRARDVLNALLSRHPEHTAAREALAHLNP